MIGYCPFFWFLHLPSKRVRLEKLVETYKLIFEDQTGEAFPQDPAAPPQSGGELVALSGHVHFDMTCFSTYKFI